MNVHLKNIQKWFGKVHANNDISLHIPAGTIQGILGENGAGKSTLMKILSGFIQADSGEIWLDDRQVTILNPADAIHLGIGMLHQDPLDFPPMKVLDNFILGEKGSILPDRKRARQAFMDLQRQFGFELSPDAYVDMLTVGERQQLEILRLLWLGARVLILDEPTTGISASQKEKLFATLRILAEQGKTIIFVSHKLEDVELLCSRVVVLCQGKLVGSASPPYVTDDLVKMMFGRLIRLEEKTHLEKEACNLVIRNLSIEDARLSIQNVSLEVKLGEVIGLAGMEGSGQRQFLRTLAGLMRPVGGSIHLCDADLTARPYHEYLKAGVRFLPASRMEEGLIPGLTLSEHFALTAPQQGFFIRQEKILQTAQAQIDHFTIRGTPASKVEALSGGNQQRALLALLQQDLRLLLLEHPTRGLDIESTIWIWTTLKERCKSGTSIIFISSDLEEILRYADRILVFFGGKVSPPLDANTIDEDELGQRIGGKGMT